VAKLRPFEGAETAAIGRALGVAGYGTQFMGDEMDEGEHLADSPVEREAGKEQKKTTSTPPRSWKPEVINAVVEAKHADNNFNAIAMLNMSVLPNNVSVTHAVSWAKYYRGARDEGKSAADAASEANNIYTEATR